MIITESEYLDIATKISNAKRDDYLLELQGIIEWKLHLLKHEDKQYG